MTDLHDHATKSDQDKTPLGADELLSLLLHELEERKADDVTVIDLQGKSSIGDYMVIATGQSGRQVAALSEHLTRTLKNAGLSGVKPEGDKQGDWILIDAGDIIVHLFRPEVRAFYNLEKMWESALAEPADTGARVN